MQYHSKPLTSYVIFRNSSLTSQPKASTAKPGETAATNFNAEEGKH